MEEYILLDLTGGDQARKENKHLSEDEIIARIEKNAYYIRYVENPSIKMQLCAVRINPFSINSIAAPAKEVQMNAVRENYYTISSIKNPDKEVLTLAQEQIS